MCFLPIMKFVTRGAWGLNKLVFLFVFSCQRSAISTEGPSCSSTSSEACEISWIKEEDNREENPSSFSGLGKICTCILPEGEGGGGREKLKNVFYKLALPRGSKPCHLITILTEQVSLSYIKLLRKW